MYSGLNADVEKWYVHMVRALQAQGRAHAHDKLVNKTHLGRFAGW